VSAYSAKIECDEDGFHLILEVDEDPEVSEMGMLDIHLDQHAAIELLRSSLETIKEWYDEGEVVRAHYERWRAGGPLPDYIQKENA
jgi:hypothetical protein